MPAGKHTTPRLVCPRGSTQRFVCGARGEADSASSVVPAGEHTALRLWCPRGAQSVSCLSFAQRFFCVPARKHNTHLVCYSHNALFLCPRGAAHFPLNSFPGATRIMGGGAGDRRGGLTQTRDSFVSLTFPIAKIRRPCSNMGCSARRGSHWRTAPSPIIARWRFPIGLIAQLVRAYGQ